MEKLHSSFHSCSHRKLLLLCRFYLKNLLFFPRNVSFFAIKNKQQATLLLMRRLIWAEFHCRKSFGSALVFLSTKLSRRTQLRNRLFKYSVTSYFPQSLKFLFVVIGPFVFFEKLVGDSLAPERGNIQGYVEKTFDQFLLCQAVH